MANTYDTSAFPLGSKDPRVLYNNASNLDDAVNAFVESWVDRFGRNRQSWYGFEQAFKRMLEGFGFSNAGAYAPGLVIVSHQQYVDVGGQAYVLKSSTTVPYTVTGDWATESANFKLAGDAILRGDLAAADGAKLIGNVADLAALRALSVPRDGAILTVLEHTTGRGLLGGGNFIFRAGATGADDNALLIKPNAVTTGNPGRYVRMLDSRDVTPEMYGAIGAGLSSQEAIDTAAILAAVATGRSIRADGDYVFSPLTTPISFPAPYTLEGNRTSACLLQAMQKIYGKGSFRWGPTLSSLGNLPQCFFKAADCSQVELDGLTYKDGFSAVIVDPIADGSVDGLILRNAKCRNMLIDFIGGRQLAIDPVNSKFSRNLSVIGMDSRAPGGSHSILFTNTYDAVATGGRFRDVTQGMCIDASQGTRGVTMQNHRARNVMFFCKLESSTVPGGTSDNLKSSHFILDDIVAVKISQNGILLNTGADQVTINNVQMEDFAFNGLLIGQANDDSFDGALAVSNSTFIGRAGSNGGIWDTMTNGKTAHTFTNVITKGSETGVRCSRRNMVINGGSISATASAVVLDTSIAGDQNNNLGGLDGVFIGGGVQLAGTVGVNIIGTGIARNIQVSGTGPMRVSVAAVLAENTSAIINSHFENFTVEAPVALPLAAVTLNNLRNSHVKGLTLNLIDGSGNGILTSGTTAGSIITGNISTRPIVVSSPDGATINTGNITTAAYRA